ncbi:MAG: CPBP family intramembrane metalloprotease [Deltaproteobacteria bacterium]|nr:CPBP family intramembrane metalloprotease [Deltaproteobacteria bacterium]
MALASLWKRYVTDQIAAADASPSLPPGRISERARVLVVYAVGALVLVAMNYGVLNGNNQQAMAGALIAGVSDLWPDLGETLARHRELVRMLMWIAGAFTMYFIVPALVVRVIFGHRLSDYGLAARGFVKHLSLYLLLFLPVFALVFVVAGSADFQRKYPLYHDPAGWADLLVWELGYAIQFFSLEFFFRGFLVHGVRDKLGAAGVFAMVLPYVMIHFSKPLYETLGAIVAGSVLGILSLRTGSIAGGVFIHTAVAWTMDLAALTHRPTLFP